jgi:hypothetical protein
MLVSNQPPSLKTAVNIGRYLKTAAAIERAAEESLSKEAELSEADGVAYYSQRNIFISAAVAVGGIDFESPRAEGANRRHSLYHLLHQK